MPSNSWLLFRALLYPPVLSNFKMDIQKRTFILPAQIAVFVFTTEATVTNKLQISSFFTIHTTMQSLTWNKFRGHSWHQTWHKTSSQHKSKKQKYVDCRHNYWWYQHLSQFLSFYHRNYNKRTKYYNRTSLLKVY